MKKNEGTFTPYSDITEELCEAGIAEAKKEGAAQDPTGVIRANIALLTEHMRHMQAGSVQHTCAANTIRNLAAQISGSR